MILIAVALLEMIMGQPLPADHYVMRTRSIKLPIEYTKERKLIREARLYVSFGNKTWHRVAVVTSDKNAFDYQAPDDGVYWFKMQLVDQNGKQHPADIASIPPDLKVVIDTSAPRVHVTNARRSGEEIVIEWTIEDKYPNNTKTKVYFRPTDNSQAWREVLLPAHSFTGVKFQSGTTDAIAVRISVVDLAGNRTEITKEFPAVVFAAVRGKSITPLVPDDEHRGIVQAGAMDPAHTNGIQRAVLREPTGRLDHRETKGREARQESTGTESSGNIESWLFR